MFHRVPTGMCQARLHTLSYTPSIHTASTALYIATVYAGVCTECVPSHVSDNTTVATARSTRV